MLAEDKLVDYNQGVDNNQGYCCCLSATVVRNSPAEGKNVLLMTILTLAIRLTILAFMLMSGPWPKAPSWAVEKPTVGRGISLDSGCVRCLLGL